MSERFLLLVVGLLVPCLGCSSSGSSGPSGEGPTCSAGSFQLSGTVGDSSESAGGTPQSYAFINSLGGNPGTLDVGFGGQAQCGPDAGITQCTAGHLHLTWSTLVANDQTVQATGTLVLSDQPGQTYCVDGASLTPRTTAEGGGVSFVLSSIGTGTCPGTGVAGAMSGCAAPSQ